MDYVHLNREHSVAILELDRGITNALNMQMVEECAQLIQEIAHDEQINALVISSKSEKFFSIGFDVPELYPLQQQEFEKFYKRFNRLCLAIYSLPVPTVAAITGHATGGGCILAQCCDFRFMAGGKSVIGLPEIKLGVPVPLPADRILRQILGDREASKLMYSGDFLQAEEALNIGLVDETYPLFDLVRNAKDKVGIISNMSLASFRAIKANRVNNLKIEINQFLVEKEALFIEMWYSEEARKLLKDAMDKF